MASTTPPQLPKIMIIAGGRYHGVFTDYCKTVIQSLDEAAEVLQSPEPLEMSRTLLSGDISSVLIVSLTPYFSSKRPFRALRDNVRRFAELQGGTTEWKLPWTVGAYYSDTFSVNLDFCLEYEEGISGSKFEPSGAGLDSVCSPKALLAKGAQKESTIYISIPESSEDDTPDSTDDTPRSTHENVLSLVTLQVYGKGKGRVGYIGDVNSESGSSKAILAICGLVKRTTSPLF
ncbi:MAG: hypothetical protein MMC33_009731 [Icmadophila ericetorum]|nr:hypothetical protein [Icmadophila ericetorum]